MEKSISGSNEVTLLHSAQVKEAFPGKPRPDTTHGSCRWEAKVLGVWVCRGKVIPEEQNPREKASLSAMLEGRVKPFVL